MRAVILGDTAGMERFRELTSAQYKCADAVFVVFAVDDQASYDDVEKWLGEANKYVNDKVPRILLANKDDLEEGRVVTPEMSQALATKCGLKLYETSAKTGKNVHEFLAEAIWPSKPAAKSGCCTVQ